MDDDLETDGDFDRTGPTLTAEYGLMRPTATAEYGLSDNFKKLFIDSDDIKSTNGGSLYSSGFSERQSLEQIEISPPKISPDGFGDPSDDDDSCLFGDGNESIDNKINSNKPNINRDEHLSIKNETETSFLRNSFTDSNELHKKQHSIISNIHDSKILCRGSEHDSKASCRGTEHEDSSEYVTLDSSISSVDSTLPENEQYVCSLPTLNDEQTCEVMMEGEKAVQQEPDTSYYINEIHKISEKDALLGKGKSKPPLKEYRHLKDRSLKPTKINHNLRISPDNSYSNFNDILSKVKSPPVQNFAPKHTESLPIADAIDVEEFVNNHQPTNYPATYPLPQITEIFKPTTRNSNFPICRQYTEGVTNNINSLVFSPHYPPSVNYPPQIVSPTDSSRHDAFAIQQIVEELKESSPPHPSPEHSNSESPPTYLQSNNNSSPTYLQNNSQSSQAYLQNNSQSPQGNQDNYSAAIPKGNIPNIIQNQLSRYNSASSINSDASQTTSHSTGSYPTDHTMSPSTRSDASPISPVNISIPIPRVYNSPRESSSLPTFTNDNNDDDDDGDDDDLESDDGNSDVHELAYLFEYELINALNRIMNDPNLVRCKINLINKNKRTPLYIAVFQNNEVAVKFMLNQGADPTKLCFREFKHSKDNIVYENVLHLACDKGFHNIVDILLKHPATDDLLQTRRQGDNLTPLLVALKRHDKHTDRSYIIRNLVFFGASLYQVEKQSGRTPLMLAIEKEQLDLVKDILERLHIEERTTLIQQTDLSGNTCLHMSAQIAKSYIRQYSLQMYQGFNEYLRCYGADSDRKNLANFTAKSLFLDLFPSYKHSK